MLAANKRKRAPARTMASAEQSSAATFRNIQPPTTFGPILTSCATFCSNQRLYHETGKNRANIKKRDNWRECSNGYGQRCRHNASAILDITQSQYRRQQQRDNTNNASVILIYSQSRDNGIVILRFHGETLLLCLYAHITISLYHNMPICALPHITAA